MAPWDCACSPHCPEPSLPSSSDPGDRPMDGVTKEAREVRVLRFTELTFSEDLLSARPGFTIGPQRGKDLFGPCPQRVHRRAGGKVAHSSGVESSHRWWETSGLSFLATTKLPAVAPGPAGQWHRPRVCVWLLGRPGLGLREDPSVSVSLPLLRVSEATLSPLPCFLLPPPAG